MFCPMPRPRHWWSGTTCSNGRERSDARSVVDSDESFHRLGIELGTRHPPELREGGLGRPRLAVGPPGGHRVEGVGHCDDPGLDGDLLAPKPVGKPAAVEALVVRA